MSVILSMANYKFMTSSDTSEFAKTESYYILTDRNEHAIDPTACLDANGLRPFADEVRPAPHIPEYRPFSMLIKHFNVNHN